MPLLDSESVEITAYEGEREIQLRPLATNMVTAVHGLCFFFFFGWNIINNYWMNSLHIQYQHSWSAEVDLYWTLLIIWLVILWLQQCNITLANTVTTYM